MFTVAGVIAGVAKAVDVTGVLTGDGTAVGVDVEVGNVVLACDDGLAETRFPFAV